MKFVRFFHGRLFCGSLQATNKNYYTVKVSSDEIDGTFSVSDRTPSPVASTTAFGVSAAVDLAKTAIVSNDESTIPMAS